MTGKTQQRLVWALVRRQHWVITRVQLLALGFSRKAIAHRVATGRLHPIYPGVYAVGRRELSELGTFIAAVLACGEGAALSHTSAAALWGIRRQEAGPIHVTTPGSRRGHEGIVLHRRKDVSPTRHQGVAVTTPIDTLIDLAASLEPDAPEATVNEADHLGLTTPAKLRRALDQTRRPGVKALRELLDLHTFAVTQTRLERRFLPIARRVGLPKPLTQAYVNGYRVDFFFPTLGLVVETDGGRHHRTPFQQTKDRRRDQAHQAAGLTVLRFTHAQVFHEPEHVEATLAAVAARLSPPAAAAGA